MPDVPTPSVTTSSRLRAISAVKFTSGCRAPLTCFTSSLLTECADIAALSVGSLLMAISYISRGVTGMVLTGSACNVFIDVIVSNRALENTTSDFLIAEMVKSFCMWIQN